MSYQVFVNHIDHKVRWMDASACRYRRMRRRVHDWAELTSKKNNTLLMVTLTYENKEDFRFLHVRDFMRKMRRRYNDRLLGYAWVAELQRRGAVHYHVLLLIRGMAKSFHADDLGLWKHGFTNCVRARSPFYIVKYAGKEKQKDFRFFPKGIRVFAVWISDQDAKTELRFRSLKNWEKGAVLADGWESLRFWRKHAIGLSEWVFWAHYDDILEAETEIRGWERLGYDQENFSVGSDQLRQKSWVVS